MFIPIILHNIRLYIYNVRYKSGTKILDFLWNVKKIKLKKNLKKSQINFLFQKKINIYFHAYDRILKVFQI
jgi:hypothetical protein